MALVCANVIQSALISYSNSMFALTVISTSPPSALTSNLDAVTVRASFCFWLMLTVFLTLPDAIVNVAVLFAPSVFSSALMVMTASPAAPLLGEIIHQALPSLYLTSAFHFWVELNFTLSVPPSTGITTEVASILISASSGVGVGVGVGSSGFSVHAMKNIDIMADNKIIRFISAMF